MQSIYVVLFNGGGQRPQMDEVFIGAAFTEEDAISIRNYDMKANETPPEFYAILKARPGAHALLTRCLYTFDEVSV